MDRIAEESLLFDYYGNLLTEKKRRVMELYHEENLSLSEMVPSNFASRGLPSGSRLLIFGRPVISR